MKSGGISNNCIFSNFKTNSYQTHLLGYVEHLFTLHCRNELLRHN